LSDDTTNAHPATQTATGKPGEISVRQIAIDGQSLRARGHEFRHSTLEGSGEGTRRDGDPIERVYHAASGGTRAPDGFGWRRVLASYVHLHFASAPDLVSVLVARAAEYRRERRAIEIGTR